MSSLRANFRTQLERLHPDGFAHADCRCSGQADDRGNGSGLNGSTVGSYDADGRAIQRPHEVRYDELGLRSIRVDAVSLDGAHHGSGVATGQHERPLGHILSTYAGENGHPTHGHGADDAARHDGPLDG